MVALLKDVLKEVGIIVLSEILSNDFSFVFVSPFLLATQILKGLLYSHESIAIGMNDFVQFELHYVLMQLVQSENLENVYSMTHSSSFYNFDYNHTQRGIYTNYLSR